MTLCSLPTELILRIFEGADVRSLLKCTEACSKLKSVITESASLQYKIELFAAAQVDNESCQTPITKKLEQLRRHQAAWRDGKWTSSYSIRQTASGLWDLRGGIFVTCTAPGRFAIDQLGSELRSIPRRTWTVALGPIITRIDCVCIDPSQDLLVVVENPNGNVIPGQWVHTIQLRSLETGAVHPDACADARIEFTGSVQFIRDAQLQIHENLIMMVTRSDMLVDGPGSRVMIWDWMTGLLLQRLSAAEIRTAVMLSKRWLLIGVLRASSRHPAILAFPGLIMVDLNASQSHGNASNLWNLRLKDFKYPQARSEVSVITVCHCPGESPSQPQHSNAPFYHDPANSFVLVSLRFTIGQDNYACNHSIPTLHLIRLAESSPSHNSQIFPWDTWGPDDTFLTIPDPLSRTNPFRLSKIAHGSRVAYGFDRGAAGFKGIVTDFRGLCLAKGTTNQHHNLWQDHIGSFFKRPFATSLRFRASTMALQSVQRPRGVLCSEDNVIIDNVFEQAYQVLVF